MMRRGYTDEVNNIIKKLNILNNLFKIFIFIEIKKILGMGITWKFIRKRRK